MPPQLWCARPFAFTRERLIRDVGIPVPPFVTFLNTLCENCVSGEAAYNGVINSNGNWSVSTATTATANATGAVPNRDDNMRYARLEVWQSSPASFAWWPRVSARLARLGIAPDPSKAGRN